MSYRFAKIIATMGPSINKETILKRLINFVDVFRINYSHGGLLSLKKYVDIIRKIDASTAIMLDTKGPEVRIKNKNVVNLKKKKRICLRYSRQDVEDEEIIYIDYPYIDELTKNVVLSIDDNKVILKIEKVNDSEVWAKILVGEEILPNKSVAFQGYSPKLDFLTEDDKQGILWAIDNNIVFIAASFVRNGEDVQQLREFLDNNGGDFVRIISKIETVEALEDIENIIKLSDGVMIARGDLGSVVPLEKLTKLTLDIIKLSNRYGKPVIVATQLLPTMVSNIIPTRAEIDEIVFNIKAGVDAFMLSEETAVGNYPYETLEWLNRVISFNYDVTNQDIGYEDLVIKEGYEITDNIIWNAYKIATQLGVKAIICPTITGYTPARLSTLKPKIPIIAFTTRDDTFKFLNLLRGVKGYKISNDFDYSRIKSLGKEIVRILLKGNVNIDDRILIVHSSISKDEPGMINGLEVYKFKDL